MSAKLEDRPTDKVREEVIDRLIMNYSHGEITLEAFERRLDEAMNTECNEDLQELVKDLPRDVDQQYVNQKKRELNFNYSPDEAKSTEKLISVLGSNSRKGCWQVPREIRTVTVFGSNELDFTDASFSHPEIKINSFCLFGSDEIFVPENVNVVSQVACVLGSVENHAPSAKTINGPTIYIEGTVIFGSIDIKIRRSVKERFMEFADSLKSLFK